MLSKDENVEFHGRHEYIWTTKYSRNVFSEEMRKTLEGMIRDLCKDTAEICSITVYPNGVYLSVVLDPTVGSHVFLKSIKRETAGKMREMYPELKSRLPNLWTNQYSCFYVGNKPSEAQIRKALEKRRRNAGID